MQTQNRLFDDLARLLGGAVGTLSGIRDEVENIFRQQFERLLVNMDLVNRDTFDALHALAQATHAHQEKLDQRLSALETRITSGSRFLLPRRLPNRRAAATLRQSARRRDGNKKIDATGV